MANPVMQLDSVDVYKRLLSYVKPYWLIFALAIIGNIAYSGVDAYFVHLLQPLLDKGFIEREASFVRWLPLLALGCFVFRGTASFTASYNMTRVGRSVVMVLRQQIFNKLLRLPACFYDKSTAGTLLSKIIYDVDQVASASTDALTTVVESGCLVIGLFTVMLMTSWRLTTIFLVIVPVIAFVISKSSRRLRKVSHRIQNAMGDVTHVAEESIEGYKVVRTFGGQEYETQKFLQVTRHNQRQELKLAAVQALSSPIVQMVAAFALAIVLYLAISPSGQQSVSAGQFTSIVAAMLAMLAPMKKLTNVNGVIQRGLAGAQSVFLLLDEENEKDLGTQSLYQARGKIIFKNMSFHYPEVERKALYDINITIEAGETVALVGRSGAGKSTLVNLLPRFYDYDEGQILLDGVELSEYKLNDLRNQFAFVSQNITLFNDTIAHNIAYGRLSEVAEAEIIRAARAAHAMEFIDELPNGLHTLIGDNGVLLSGGQRQRIAIARAILKDAPILILDEATSALDTESEKYIQSALDEFMKNRTTLVIAHRLSTILNADKIMVMDQGRIVEIGNHQTLLEKNGYYAKLYSMQFAKDQQMLADNYV